MEEFKSKWFKKEEFMCKCGCKEIKISQELVTKLDRMRDIVARPITIASGYRCPKRNEQVGGVTESAHMSGLAADLYVRSSRDRFLLMQAALAVGLHRVGVGNNFVHVDIDATKPQDVIWTYKN